MRVIKIIFLLSIVYCLLSTVDVLAQEQAFVYESKGKRDPFIPLMSSDGYLINIEPEPDSSQTILQGLVYDPGGISYAIINGQVVRENAFVGAVKVLKIEKDKVIILKDEQKLELTVMQEE